MPKRGRLTRRQKTCSHRHGDYHPGSRQWNDPCPECAAERRERKKQRKKEPPQFGNDPAKGFVLDRVPYVSAATLAYDRNPPPVMLVDRPFQKKGVVRIAGPFTVESESPWRTFSPDDPRLFDSQRDADLHLAITSALEISGVSIPGTKERLRLDCLTPYATKNCLLTHLAPPHAVAVFPDDITVPPPLIEHAANDAAALEGIDTLLVIAFAFEAGTVVDRPGLRILRAQANRDLMIGNLKSTPKDTAFVLVGEPTVEIAPASRPPGFFTCEVRGYLVFDPATGNLREGKPSDIDCWMIDTDYTGPPFDACMYHLPGRDNDRQLLRLKRALGKQLNRDAWNAMLSMKSIPFPAPPSGKVAVRIITHSGAEMEVVLPVP